MNAELISSEFLGDIPQSWRILPLKSLFFLSKGLSITKADLKDSGLPVVIYGQIHSKANTGTFISDDMVRFVSDDFSSYTSSIAIKDGFIFADTSEDLEGCGNNVYVDSDNLIFGGYHTIVLTPKQAGNNKYLAYLFKTDVWRSQIKKQLTEVKLFSVTQSVLSEVYIALPPQDTQSFIVDFLDTKVSQINTAISRSKSIIEKLQEYRKSVITQAVTKGLDPNVEMKESKAPYIDFVPKNWTFKRAKFIAKSISKGSGITRDDVDKDGDISCVRYGEIYTSYEQSFDECCSKTNLENVSSPQYFEYGDMLFTATGELISEIGKNIVYLGNERCLAGGDIIIFKHSQEPRYLNYLMNSTAIQAQKSCGKSKLKVVHISGEEIGNLKIYLPDATEQSAIADYLDEKCSNISEAISRQESIIEKLEEYKKSLIYNAVTGKIDCRKEVV